MKGEPILKKWTQAFMKRKGFPFLNRYKARGKIGQMSELSIILRNCHIVLS